MRNAYWLVISLTALLLLLPSTTDAQEDPENWCKQGYELFEDDKFDEALPLLKKGFDNRESTIFNDLDNLGKCALALGVIKERRGEMITALEAYQVALNTFQKTNNRGFEGNTLNNVGQLYLKQGRYKEALDELQQALIIADEVGNDSLKGQILNHIGQIYGNQGDYDEALEYFDQALIIIRGQKNREDEARLLNSIASINYYQGRYDEALKIFEQTLVIRREVKDRSGEAHTLNNIGQIHADQSNYATALDYFQQALAIRRDIGDQIGEASTLNSIGALYDYQGRFSEALELYEQALRLHRKLANRSSEAITLGNMGAAYAALGRYAEALDYYQQSLAIKREIHDKDGEMVTLINIGDTYNSQGRYEEALEFQKEALSLAEELGNLNGQATASNNMGSILLAQEKYDEALDNFQRAVELYQNLGRKLDAEIALANIGHLFANREQYQEALVYYRQALDVAREIEDRLGEGITLNDIGSIHADLNQLDDALQNYEQALAILKDIGDRVHIANTYNNLGNLYEKQEKYDEALENYRQAIAFDEELRATAGSETARTAFAAQRISRYRKIVDLLHLQKENEQAFAFAEQSRARSFLDSLATGQIQLNDNPAAILLLQEQKLYDQRRELQDALAAAKAELPSDLDLINEIETELDAVEVEYQETLNEIEGRSAELASLVPGRSADMVLSVEQVQSLLDDQTTLVSYYMLEDNVLAFIVTPDSFETIALEVDPTTLEQEIKGFRGFANVTESYPASAVALYKMLILPLEDNLPLPDSLQGTQPHLAIIPHQSLHYLPFAGLTDGESYLIDDYTLTILPSASALPFIQENVQQTAYSGQPSVLIAGNPVTADYDTVTPLGTTHGISLGALPFAEKQAETIAELFGAEPLIGEAATESAIRQQVPQVNILHLAAHGQFNPVAPLNSFIALAPDEENDGWLTVGEVYGLSLENVNLTVLSACETLIGEEGLETGLGVTAGDELVGLTRALIFAGTPSVIASLWAVEDEATSLLMEQFYTHLKDGVGKAEALRQAQIEVREEYPNPYYWSGFVLSGDGGESREIITQDDIPILEIAESANISNPDALGKIEVEYPISLSSGSSDVVRSSIHVSELLASLEPMAIKRKIVPSDAPPIAGELELDHATILIKEMMRVELSGPAFQIEGIYPTVQPVDTKTIANPTFWAWNILAPNTLGKHILTVQVYLNEDAQPSWVRSYQVEVVEFAPHSTTTTPLSAVSFDTFGSVIGMVAIGISIVIFIIAFFVARVSFSTTNSKASDQQTLKILYGNLGRLEAKAARYGLDVPTKIENEIELTRDQIAVIEKKLAARGVKNRDNS